VNRIWMHHFGRGIVQTPENFGLMGSRPTHPELLDWLAVDFMENGWKMKRLHKMIMTSTVYRQSSRRVAEDEPSTAETVDPANDLLWRMNLRRLEAEVVRDTMLAVSGKLDLTIGGAPIPLASGVDGLVTVSEKGSAPASQWRRSLYVLARRNYSLSFLDVFDFPVMALNCTQRTNSATPLQSLTMMNSEFVMQRAEDLAVRVTDLVGAGAPDERKIEMAFLLGSTRKPTAEETHWCAEHMQRQRQRYLDVGSSAKQASQNALASLCQMLMATNEFLYVE